MHANDLGCIPASVDAQVLSKSALKNKKRREKKHNAPRVTNNDEETLPIASPPIVTPPPDPRTVLKKQLEEAKAAKVLNTIRVCL